MSSLGPTLAWAIPFLAHILLTLQVVRLNLRRTYPALLFLQIASLVQGLVLFYFQMRAMSTPAGPERSTFLKGYGFAYFATSPILWIAFYFLLTELYSSVFKHYPGITGVSRLALRLSFAASILIGLIAFSTEGGFAGGIALNSPQFREVFALAQRTILGSALFFLLCLTAMTFWFPIRLGKNTIIYLFAYAVLFGFKFAAAVLRENTFQIGNLLSTIVSVVAMLYLAFSLRRESQQATVSVSANWQTDSEEAVRAQLDSLNHALGRIARKV